ASDGTSTTQQSFTWTVDHLGIDNPGDQSNQEGDSVSLQVSATDADGDSLSYSAGGLPPGLSINSSTGLISGAVAQLASNLSPYQVTVAASDGTHSASASFSWDVTHIVIANPGGQINAQGDSVSLPISASDSDGDPLSYSAGGLPAGLSINSTT